MYVCIYIYIYIERERERDICLRIQSVVSLVMCSTCMQQNGIGCGIKFTKKNQSITQAPSIYTLKYFNCISTSLPSK